MEKTWSILLHVGRNMWPGIPRRLQCDDAVLRRVTEKAAAAGCNQVVVDVGESLVFPSHPELAVPGSWTPERYRLELDRLRRLGLEPIPKLNFSTAHHGWLGEYGRMVSSPTYYAVCSALIRDVCEVFGRPRLFHIGFDEEKWVAVSGYRYAVMRHGDLWWHDFLFMVDQVERNGAQAWCWSDYMWEAREEFFRRMPRSVLQSNWCYRRHKVAGNLVWDELCGKRGPKDWGGTNAGIAFAELEKHGYDQLPCVSNIYEEEAVDAVMRYCRAHIAPERLKGFQLAPWRATQPEAEAKIMRGIDLFIQAKGAGA